MASNLIIDDDYINEVARLSFLRGRKLEEVIDSYVVILEDIKSQAIVSGEISRTLDEYISCLKLIDDRLLNISKKMKKISEGFLIDINNADEYLF